MKTSLYRIASPGNARVILTTATSRDMAFLQAFSLGIEADVIHTIPRVKPQHKAPPNPNSPEAKARETVRMIRAWAYHRIQMGDSRPFDYGYDSYVKGIPREDMPHDCIHGWDVAKKMSN